MTATRPKLARNALTVCLFHGLQMSLFPMAIITIFYQQEIGMSMSEILMLQGTFGLAMALFEFPSGYLADRIGYRTSLLIASVMMIFGWGLYVFAGSFAAIIVAEFILGIAMSLISGTDVALLYESLLETEKEHEYALWNGRFQFTGQSAEGAAALGAGFLYAFNPRAPFMIESAIWAVAFLVAWTLVEPARHRPTLTDNWSRIRSMFRRVFRDDLPLRAIIALTIVLGMASFVPVWTIQIYATEDGVPETWLGPIWAIANFTVALGALFSHRLEARFGFRRVIGSCIAFIAIGYLGLASTHALYGFAFYYALTIMRGVFGPTMNAREQRLLPSSDRAGFLSLRSLIFRGSFLALALPVGLAIDGFGQRPVYLVLGAMLVGAALYCARKIHAPIA